MRRALGVGAVVACTLFCACVTSPTGRSQLLLVSPEAVIVESARAYAGRIDRGGSAKRFGRSRRGFAECDREVRRGRIA